MLAAFRRRRDVIVSGLNAVPTASPAWSRAAPSTPSRGSRASACPPPHAGRPAAGRGGRRLPPGTAFGAHGEGYLRFSYATDAERLREGLERIGRVAAALEGR